MSATPEVEIATTKDIAALGELRVRTGWYASTELLGAALAWENAYLAGTRSGPSIRDRPIQAEIVASTSALAADQVGVIGNVVVHHEFRRRGLGRIITGAAVEWLEQRRVPFGAPGCNQRRPSALYTTGICAGGTFLVSRTPLEELDR